MGSKCLFLAALLLAVHFPLSAQQKPNTVSLDPWNGSYVGFQFGEITNPNGATEVNAGWTEGERYTPREGISDATSPFFSSLNESRGEDILRAVGQNIEFNDTDKLVGVQFGRNWRFDNAGEQGQTAVLGVEFDISFSDLKGRATETNEYFRGFEIVIPGLFGLTTTTLKGGFSAPLLTEAQSEINNFSTLRGRAGFLLSDTTLLFATAGLAAGHVKAKTKFSGQYCQKFACTDYSSITRLGRFTLPPLSFEGGDAGQSFSSEASRSSTRFGLVGGFGLEHQIEKNVTFKAEFLAYDLGSMSINNTFTIDGGEEDSFSNSPATISKTDSFSFRGKIWRMGLNFHY